MQAGARHWSGSLADAERWPWAVEACAGPRPGSPRWFTAQQTALYGASVRGDGAAILTRLVEARTARPKPEACPGLLLCLCEAVYAAQVLGDTEQLAALSDEMEQHAA